MIRELDLELSFIPSHPPPRVTNQLLVSHSRDDLSGERQNEGHRIVLEMRHDHVVLLGRSAPKNPPTLPAIGSEKLKNAAGSGSLNRG